MKIYKQNIGARIFDYFNYAFMIFLCIIMLYPMLNTFAISFSDPVQVAQGKVSWYPKGLELNGYAYIFKDSTILRSYGNTILYVVLGTSLQLLFTSLFAYPLATKNFLLRKHLTIFVVITMIFNGGLIPTYMLMRSLGLFNSIWVIVLPSALSAFSIIIYRTFFQEIPSEMRESAFLDGANDLTVLFRIYLPLSKPLLATFALFGAVGLWNMWFEAMIFLNKETMHPVQMMLRHMILETENYTSMQGLQRYVQTTNVNPKNIKMAAVVVTILPILFIYPALQKHFVAGMMIGSVKG